MPYLPTLKQLRYLIALSETGHFGRAAEASFVSQSAFSTAIQELETILGATLVDRTRKHVTITPLGHDIIKQAQLCLHEAKTLVEMARAEQGSMVGRLYLGIIPTIAPFMLPRLLPSLREQYPELSLYLREEQTDVLLEQLNKGDIDVILMALPYETPHMQTLPLGRDAFRLACHQSSHWVNPKHYEYKQLPADSILLLEDGHCLRNHALSACKIKQSEKVSRFAASSLLTLIQMVDADLGITYLPAVAEGSALLAGTQIKTYPLDKSAYREIGLVWRRGSARSAEFKLLGDSIQSLFF